MKVRFTVAAAERYDNVLAYLREQNPVAADHMVAAVDRALASLKRFPRRGLRVREFPSIPLQQFLVMSHRFFYIIHESARVVVIVDVWHVAQIPDEPQLPALQS